MRTETTDLYRLQGRLGVARCGGSALPANVDRLEGAWYIVAPEGEGIEATILHDTPHATAAEAIGAAVTICASPVRCPVTPGARVIVIATGSAYGKAGSVLYEDPHARIVWVKLDAAPDVRVAIVPSELRLVEWVESPEESVDPARWRCPNPECAYHNDADGEGYWRGYDDRGYDPSVECDCGALDDEDAECVCVTTLAQDFDTFPEGEITTLYHRFPEGEITTIYHQHDGGADSEIGDYTRICCRACKTWLWRDLEHATDD